MRRALVILMAAEMMTGAALAADVAAVSRVESVTVFPTGAEVTRVAKVAVAAGDHTIVFTDLPAQAVPGSIRVEGKSAGRLEIGSVDTRRVKVPRADPVAQASERRRIEGEIEKLRDERAGIEAGAKAATSQLALIEKLTELPQHPAPAGPQGSPAMPDWGQLFVLIGQRSAEAQRSLLDARVKLRDLDRRIDDLGKKLASLAPTQDERTEARVFVAAGGQLEAELAVRYQVTTASWIPYYDARLATGNKTVAPKLALARRASIQQRTGEDWVDVALQLSTTRPGTGTSAPDLYPMTVDYEPDAPPPRPMPMAAPPPAAGAARSRSMVDMAAVDEERKDKVAAEAVALPAQQRQAQVDAAAFQAVFTVPGKLTVMATGEQKRVQLDAADLEPTLVVRTVPRVNPKAFLYTKLTMPRTTPYLPGQVSLFRDGTFVGNGRLPQLAPGEELELGFGPDDALRVRHALVDEKRGESGIITSSKTDVRNYRITVKNLHERAIQLSILDQIPVSNNQEIKVELTGKQPPSRQNIDDKRGVLQWDSKLEPDEERVLEFGYRVQWPAAKRIQYGR